jgi:cell wall assembly regulator SMI1
VRLSGVSVTGGVEEGFARLHALVEWQDHAAVSPQRLRDALRRADDVLARAGAPVVRGLQPGLGADEVRDQMASLGLTAPDDLLVWFGWHNGYRAPPGEVPDRNMFYLALPMSLVELVSRYSENYFEAQIEELGEPNMRWFPVVGIDSTWSHIVMDCGHDPTTAGQVAGFNAHSAFAWYVARTLAEPVEWWLEFVDTGLWRYDDAYARFTPAYSYDEGSLWMPQRMFHSCMGV